MARNAPVSSTEILGTRLLKEIENEEGTLEDLLKDLRASTIPNPSRTGISDLNSLLLSHGGRTVSISGRPLPLVYHLVAALISSNGTVAIIDLEHRFSPSHLPPSLASQDLLKHVYVWHPTQENLKITIDSVEGFMLHGSHDSKDRIWKGLFVLGGNVPGRGVDIGDVLTVTTGWRGWMRVEREEVRGFLAGTSVGEAWSDREARESAVQNVKWRAVCDTGEFMFK